MNNQNNDINSVVKFDNLEDLEKQKKRHNSELLAQIKNCAVSILKWVMWFISIAFTFYIIRYLYLTAFFEDSKVADKMQDIIVKVSGWVLFVLSQAGIIKKRKDEE
jgi:multidrug resistance efflux pump